MTCTEEYKEHIEYTFHAFCKIVIRNASYTALRTWSRKHKREISLDYITDEKHYPLGTTDEYFKAPEPDEEYIVHLCGDTVILSNGLLVQALSRLPAQKQEMLYLSFFMTDKKEHIRHSMKSTAPADCVTEIRIGNSVLVVSGFFKQGAKETAADKMAKVLEAETATQKSAI